MMIVNPCFSVVHNLVPRAFFREDLGEKALASAGHVTNLHPAEVGVLFFGGLSQPFAYESDLL